MPIISKENAEENLSEIEKIRLRNIAERKKKFEELNLDSLKKKAMAHSDYLKAQKAAKRLKCHKCDPIKQFPNFSLKRYHDIAVHIGPRSSYPRVPVKETAKKPRTEYPFISKLRKSLGTPQAFPGQIAYCNICCTRVVNIEAHAYWNHRKAKTHQKNIESVMDQKCGICKMVVSEDLTAHLMTHMKPCSVLIFKFE